MDLNCIIEQLSSLTPEQTQVLLLTLQQPQKSNQTKRYLTSQEAGKILSKSANAMRMMVHRDQIKSYKQGERLYFLESDLIEWVEKGKKKTAAEMIMEFEDDLVVKGGKWYA